MAIDEHTLEAASGEQLLERLCHGPSSVGIPAAQFPRGKCPPLPRREGAFLFLGDKAPSARRMRYGLTGRSGAVSELGGRRVDGEHLAQRLGDLGR